MVADGLHRGAAERAVFGQEPANFLHEAGGEHLLDAGIDAPVQLFARPGKDEDLDGRGGAAFVELRLQMAESLAGELENFQAANDPPLVVGMQFGGQQRIDDLQPLVQCGQRQRLQLSFDLTREIPNRPAALDRRRGAATSNTAACRRRTAPRGRGL